MVKQNLSIESLRTGGRRLLLLQMIVVFAFAALMYGFFNVMTAYSAMVGGVVCITANWYFIRRFFKTTSPQDAQQIVKSFYWSEFVKLAISAVLFVIFIKYFHIQPLPFLVAYLLASGMYWFAPLLFRK